VKPTTAVQKEARKLCRVLKETKTKLVFAESCTAGLAAQILTETPGISDWFCGSLVCYRNDSKKRWLRVKPSTLRRFTAVSPECAREMAQGALIATPEAKVSVSVTGYLGPTGEEIGKVFIGLARRGAKTVHVQEFSLLPSIDRDDSSARKRSLKKPPLALREERRRLAAQAMFFLVRSLLV